MIQEGTMLIAAGTGILITVLVIVILVLLAFYIAGRIR